MGILDLKYNAFGLDINDSSLKIVQLKKKNKSLCVSSFNEVKITPGIIEDGVIKKEASLARIIKYACSTVKGEKIKTKYVVLSLPEEKSFLQVIQMPKMTDEELKIAVPFEAENYIPLPIEEVYLDFQVIPSVKDNLNRLEVLLVAMPRKIVDSYVSCIKKADLIPIILESESEAITRSLIKKDTKLSFVVLVDFGEDKTNLVVYSGQSVRFTCSIPISSKMLTNAIAESLKVDLNTAEKLKIKYGISRKKQSKTSVAKKSVEEKVASAIIPVLEDLATQIKKYINFYKDHSSFEYFLPDTKIEKIIFCGGGSELKGLLGFISDRLEIPAELGDPSINFVSKKIKTVIKKDHISLATAIGLASRGIL
jgi:type IV pilus assembly protein PilM